MQYAIVSVLIPKEYEEKFRRFTKNTMQDAANALQWNIYRGLCSNLGEEIPLFNLLPCDSYPQYYKYPFIPSFPFDKKGQNLSFCNVKVIRSFFRAKALEKALRHWCKASDEPKTLFVYTISQPILAAVSRVKKEFGNIHVCAIVADLPNMSSLSSKKSVLHSVFTKIKANDSYSLLPCVNSFVLLTKYMAEYMRLSQPFCVMEGIAPEPNEAEAATQTGDVQTILYTGTLHRKFGVLHLVEAFQKIADPNVRLVICGIGDSEAEIRNAAMIDKRIDFKGQVRREQVLSLQKDAAVLVNPRLDNEEFTKYSFPSKTLEYLASGTPVVAYKLDGIPDEYDPFISYPKDDSAETLAETLQKLCRLSKDERKQIGLAAQDFVLKEKNRYVQTKKMLDFVRNAAMAEQK